MAPVDSRAPVPHSHRMAETSPPLLVPCNLTRDAAARHSGERACGITLRQRDECLAIVRECIAVDGASFDPASPRSLAYWAPVVMLMCEGNRDIPDRITRPDLAHTFALYLRCEEPNKRRFDEAVRHAVNAGHIAVAGKCGRLNLYRLTSEGRRRAATLIRGAHATVRRERVKVEREAAEAAARKAMQAPPVERDGDGDATGHALSMHDRVQRITSGECGTTSRPDANGAYIAWDNGKVTWEQYSELQPEPESKPEPASAPNTGDLSPAGLRKTLTRALEREADYIRNQIIRCEGHAMPETLRYLRTELRGCEYLLASARDGELQPEGGCPRPTHLAAS